MADRIELTDRSYIDNPRKSDGPRLCTDVRSWGFLAARTASEKDFYHDDISNNKDINKAQITVAGHFFCQKYDSTGSPTVLVVKLFLDAMENPQGLPITTSAEMTSNEHFAEWRMVRVGVHFDDSLIEIFRVPDDQIWFHGMPPIPVHFTPWEILYNLFVLPFKQR